MLFGISPQLISAREAQAISADIMPTKSNQKSDASDIFNAFEANADQKCVDFLVPFNSLQESSRPNSTQSQEMRTWEHIAHTAFLKWPSIQCF
jgi:hypothetical protein